MQINKLQHTEMWKAKQALRCDLEQQDYSGMEEALPRNVSKACGTLLPKKVGWVVGRGHFWTDFSPRNLWIFPGQGEKKLARLTTSATLLQEHKSLLSPRFVFVFSLFMLDFQRSNREPPVLNSPGSHTLPSSDSRLSLLKQTFQVFEACRPNRCQS